MPRLCEYCSMPENNWCSSTRFASTPSYCTCSVLLCKSIQMKKTHTQNKTNKNVLKLWYLVLETLINWKVLGAQMRVCDNNTAMSQTK